VRIWEVAARLEGEGCAQQHGRREEHKAEVGEEGEPLWRAAEGGGVLEDDDKYEEA
jgi:hypothetical protein